jgi:leucyl aminopeptidase
MLEIKALDPARIKVDILAIAVAEDRPLSTADAVVALVARAKGFSEFCGEKDQELLLYDPAGFEARRVMLIGLGKAQAVDAESLRRFGAIAVNRALSGGLFQVALLAPESMDLPLKIHPAAKAMLEGACLANHVFGRYKKEEKKQPVKKIQLLIPAATSAKALSGLIGQVSTVCQATLTAREWVNTPSNDKTPTQLAQAIATLARKAKLKVTLIPHKELKAKQFGALLAVAQGSQNPPCLLVIEYAPPRAEKTIALVGKGVTFDAGGINLKSSSGLEDMKADMAGCAAVGATLLALAGLKPRVRVVGVMPLVENMPSGNAFRPGDIIQAYDGKTVEVGNTDAEGRLILIDAMAWAIEQYQPDTLIDLATLTGACVVALGERIAGLFSPDDDLAQALLSAAATTHERCWRMPLPDDYRKKLKSDLADIRNIGDSRWGGAIVAALFLSEFVEKTRWAHIDIAGPAYVKKGNAYCGPGATGFGVRLLCDYIASL